MLLIAGLLAVAGCNSWPPAADSANRAQLAPVLQRMRDFYPDLANGRFISLADFETPGQSTLFRVVGDEDQEEGRAQPTLSVLRSRDETGAGSLKTQFRGPSDRLLLDGRRSAAIGLIRDWRRYGLLLMSIHGPPAGVTLGLAVESGDTMRLRWARTLVVKPGWNLFRIDLDTVGDHIDLADVRSLAWHVPNLTEPVEFYLDDILITDNTQHQLGQQAGPGELYVFTRGRRIHVGVRECFELAFADGQIVAWRSGDDGNLVDVGGLGPWPIPLPRDWDSQLASAIAYDDPQLFADWGPVVAATQNLVEATPFRVVVAGQWRFVNEPAPPPPNGTAPPAPEHAWQYTIYPFGQVCVRIRSSTASAAWHDPRVGYAIGLDGHHDFTAAVDPALDRHGDRPRYVLLARAARGRADLLWTWAATSTLDRQRMFASADDRRLAVVVGDIDAAPIVETAHLLRVWPPDIDGPQEGASFAGDYRHPAGITATVGRLVTDAPGDLNQDGFNESEGCHELALDGDVLRCEFQPAGRLRFDPVFRVHGSAGRRCWVYARGRPVKTVGRDGSDNLLFRLPHVAGGPLALEVHATPLGTGP